MENMKIITSVNSQRNSVEQNSYPQHPQQIDSISKSEANTNMNTNESLFTRNGSIVGSISSRVSNFLTGFSVSNLININEQHIKNQQSTVTTNNQINQSTTSMQSTITTITTSTATSSTSTSTSISIIPTFHQENINMNTNAINSLEHAGRINFIRNMRKSSNNNRKLSKISRSSVSSELQHHYQRYGTISANVNSSHYLNEHENTNHNNQSNNSNSTSRENSGNRNISFLISANDHSCRSSLRDSVPSLIVIREQYCCCTKWTKLERNLAIIVGVLALIILALVIAISIVAKNDHHEMQPFKLPGIFHF